MTAALLRNCYFCGKALDVPGIACEQCQTAYPAQFDVLVNGYAETLGEAEAARRDRAIEVAFDPIASRAQFYTRETH